MWRLFFGGGGAAPDEAEGVEAELGGFEGVFEGLLVGFEVGDFLFADGVVELAEVAEASEFVEELGLHGGGGGFGEFLGAFAGDFLGATEHFGDDFVLDGRLIEEALGAATDEGGVVEFGLVGDVFEGVVDDDADGGGGEEAVDVEGGGCGAFGDVNALDEEAVGFGATPDGEGGVALFAAEEEIEGAADEGVVGGEEGELLTRQGAGPVEGDGEAFFGQGGEGVGDEFAAMEEVVAVGEFFDMESEEVEHLNEEGFEVAVFVSGAEVVEEFVDLGGRAGAEFEEAVLTASETGLEFLVRGGGFFDEGGEVFFGEAVGKGGDFGGESGLDFGGAVDGGFEGVEALVIPESEGFGAGAGEVGNVDVDGGGLADAVEAADALLEEFDVAGEVEEDEVVGELEVAAFAADFGANEEADALTNEEFGGFDLGRRVEVDLSKVPWLLLPEMLKASEELYAEIQQAKLRSPAPPRARRRGRRRGSEQETHGRVERTIHT